jgi:hypothetical protein
MGRDLYGGHHITTFIPSNDRAGGADLFCTFFAGEARVSVSVTRKEILKITRLKNLRSMAEIIIKNIFYRNKRARE